MERFTAICGYNLGEMLNIPHNLAARKAVDVVGEVVHFEHLIIDRRVRNRDQTAGQRIVRARAEGGQFDNVGLFLQDHAFYGRDADDFYFHNSQFSKRNTFIRPPATGDCVLYWLFDFAGVETVIINLARREIFGERIRLAEFDRGLLSLKCAGGNG